MIHKLLIILLTLQLFLIVQAVGSALASNSAGIALTTHFLRQPAGDLKYDVCTGALGSIRLESQCQAASSKPEMAIQILERVPARQRTDLVHWDLVRLYIQIKDFSRAKDNLESLQWSLDTLVQMGTPYTQSQHPQVIQIFLEQAANLTGGGLLSRQTRGLWALQLGEYARAQNYLGQCLTDSPDDLYTINLLGLTYRAQGELTKAISLWRRGLILSPNNPTYSVELAEALIARNQNGDRKLAASLLQNVIRLYPDDPDAGDLIKALESER
jgi:tetratricopeptide (TPR) repeat protein